MSKLKKVVIVLAVVGIVRVAYQSYKVYKENNRPKQSVHQVEEYLFENREDADNTLSKLKDVSKKYGCVSVADYYDLVEGLSDMSDNTYGWSYDEICKTEVVHVRGGYVIKFPPSEIL